MTDRKLLAMAVDTVRIKKLIELQILFKLPGSHCCWFELISETRWLEQNPGEDLD